MANSRFWIVFVIPLLYHAANGSSDNNQTLMQMLISDLDLSEFARLVKQDYATKSMLEGFELTAFVPTNNAFMSYDGPLKEKPSLPYYHLVNGARKLSTLDDNNLPSAAPPSPPLYITRVGEDPQNMTIYINNARIVPSRSDHEFYTQVSSEPKLQVLHVIEEVLEPVVNRESNKIENPRAFKLLEQFDQYNFEAHHVRTFYNRVMKTVQQSEFQNDGRHTFFIPVDKAFQMTLPDKVDEKIVAAHIIPNKVLFTAPTKEGVMYETRCFTSQVKVFISFASDTNSTDQRKMVRSHTITGDQAHPRGTVLVDIVHGNIPVANGVVHLINRPLVIVDNTVSQFIEMYKEKGGPLHEFYRILKDYGNDLMQKIKDSRKITLFAPSDKAWKDLNVKGALENGTFIREILKSHVVDMEAFTSSEIASRRLNSVQTMAAHRKIYFNVVSQGDKLSLTVEGGGVNASVIHADIAATNGVLHIIDRVLGIPHATLREKLSTDPALKSTFSLIQASDMATLLMDTTKNYTFFAPSDYAWDALNLANPTMHNILFNPERNYEAKNIMQRHVIVAPKMYTMEQLESLAKDEFVLPSLRDNLSIKVKSDNKGYQIFWNQEWIAVSRPDVQCINGIIHVIDKALIDQNDIQVAIESAAWLATPSFFLLTTLASFTTAFFYLNVLV